MRSLLRVVGTETWTQPPEAEPSAHVGKAGSSPRTLTTVLETQVAGLGF